MGRFLTEVAKFEHCAPVAGSVEHVAADGSTSVLMLLQAAVAHQGDAWSLAVDHLARQLERVSGANAPKDATVVDAGFLARVQTLAQRTAGLHAALAQPTGDPAFDPEPLLAQDLQRWAAQAPARHRHAQSAAPECAPWPDALQLPAQRVLRAETTLDQRLPALKRCIQEASRPGCMAATGWRRCWSCMTTSSSSTSRRPGTSGRERRAAAGADRRGQHAVFVRAGTPGGVATGAHAGPSLRREQVARAWCEAARERFLQTYAQAISAAGLDADVAAQAALLELFELDRAVHELHDALQRRPEAIAAALAVLAARVGP